MTVITPLCSSPTPCLPVYPRSRAALPAMKDVEIEHKATFVDEPTQRSVAFLAVHENQPVVERGAQSVDRAVALCELPLCSRQVLCTLPQIHVGKIVASWHPVIRVDPQTGSVVRHKQGRAATEFDTPTGAALPPPASGWPGGGPVQPVRGPRPETATTSFNARWSTAPANAAAGRRPALIPCVVEPSLCVSCECHWESRGLPRDACRGCRRCHATSVACMG